MPTTTFTPIDALKQALRDQGNHFLSDEDYQRILDSHADRQATFTAARINDSTWSVAYVPLCLHAASFTEEPGASYELSCGGGGLYATVSLRLTAGTDLRETIEVSGCVVDFNVVLAEILKHLAGHRAQEYVQQLNGGRSVDPQTASKELRDMASVLLGVRAV